MRGIHLRECPIEHFSQCATVCGLRNMSFRECMPQTQAHSGLEPGIAWARYIESQHGVSFAFLGLEWDPLWWGTV